MSEMKDVTHHEVGGESVFSFDEVESVVNHKNQVLEEAEDGGAWQKVEQLSDSVEKLVKHAEKKAKIDEKKSANTGEKENAADFDPTKLSGEAEEAQAKEEQKEIKKILARLGEENQEISPDLTFKHKVDGQEIDVNIQELLNNFSGKQAWDKRFQNLDAERKAFLSERKMIEDYVSEFSNKIKNNDALGAMEYLAQFAGVNPLEFRKSVRESLEPQIKKFIEMDEGQRKLFNQSEELDFLRRQRESDIQKQTQEQSRRQLEGQVSEFQKTRGLNEEALVQLHDDIKKTYDGEITLELMGNVLDAEARFVRADSILDTVDKSLKEVNENIDMIVKVIKEYPEFSDEDLVDIVKETFANPLKQASKAVSKKAQQGKQESKDKPVATSTAQSKMDKMLLQFDDL